MALKSWKLTTRAQRVVGYFARDSKGGIALTFALTFPVIAFLSLVVVDYSRASAAKQALQDTLDAASLIVARSTALLPDAVDMAGDKAFAAQLRDANISGVAVDPATGRIAHVTFTPVGNKIVGSAHAEVSPLVSQLFLRTNMQIAATSEVTRTINKLEIALVLDTTGSMQGTKLDNLKLAASAFIDQMAAAAARSTEPNPVKIAIVPFSTTVKVSAPISLATYNDTSHTMADLPVWLDGRGRAWNDSAAYALFDDIAGDRFTYLKQMNVSWEGCVEARRAPYDVLDTAPVASDTKTLFTPYFWPDDPDSKSVSGNKNGNFGTFYNSYLTDKIFSTTDWKKPQRDHTKYAINGNASKLKSGTFNLGSAYGAPLKYGPNAGCAMKQMQRLSTDFAGLKNVINGVAPDTGLVASGETNIPLGLMWGWHALSPNEPFKDGVAYGTSKTKTQKIIILMTDGDNTMLAPPSTNDNGSLYHGYGYIWQNHLSYTGSNTDTRTEKMDGRLTTLCANLKDPLKDGKGDNAIVLYTIGVGVSDNAKQKLQGCATAPSSDHYYNVDSQAGNLASAFSAIAGSIENLRISH